MKAFDLTGKEVFLTEFSSNITCFDISSISKEKNIELISGSLDGTVYVMDIKGNPIWEAELKSPIICMETGDIIEDSRSEVIVGLEDRRLIGLDNEGKEFLKYVAKETILDCTIGYFSDDFLGKIFVLLKSGKIINVDNKGNSVIVSQLQNSPTSISFCEFYGQPTLIIGDKAGSIKIINSDLEIIGEYSLEDKITSIDNKIMLSEYSEDVFLVVASKNTITLLSLRKGNILESNKKLVKIDTQSQPPPVLKEESVTEQPKDKQAEPDIPPKVAPTTTDVEPQTVRVLRGGQIEGGDYIFKVKVINNKIYNITDVDIHILSYPEESLVLSRVDGHQKSSTDRAKFHKISKGGGFVSPSFVFKPKKDCLKGKIHAVINFIDEEDRIKTINVEPHDIRIICGLLRPKKVTSEEFDELTSDLLTFKKVGQDLTIYYKPEQLYQKLFVLLKNKNFAIIDSEQQDSSGEFLGVIKGFAEGTFKKNAVGLKLTITGTKGEQFSTLKVEVFAEDKDMTPSIINEFENAVNPQSCQECDGNIPIDLIKQMMTGSTAYCEACGSQLHELSGE
jgi:WD40 repeat protein